MYAASPFYQLKTLKTVSNWKPRIREHGEDIGRFSIRQTCAEAEKSKTVEAARARQIQASSRRASAAGGDRSHRERDYSASEGPSSLSVSMNSEDITEGASPLEPTCPKLTPSHRPSLLRYHFPSRLVPFWSSPCHEFLCLPCL